MAAAPTPKDRFTALDTLAVVREIRNRPRLRVDKAFDLPGGGWGLSVRAPGHGRSELRLVPGRYAALVPSGAEHSEDLSPFARELRRLLTGAVVTQVHDPAGERQVELELARGDAGGPILLALELFSPGNLFVVTGGTIVAVAAPRRWAHRTVRVGAPYSRAPARVDPFSADASAIEATLTRSRTDLISTLAARLGLGGPLAEELVVRLELDPHRPASTDAPTTARGLHATLASLRAEVGEAPKGHLVVRGGVAVDATPYPSRRWEGQPDVVTELRETFSDAAETYFRSLVPTPVDPGRAAAEGARRNLERQAEQQRAAIGALASEADELQRRGEALLLAYGAVEAAKEAARAAGTSEAEVDLGGRTVTVPAAGTARETAQALFAESKERRGKLDGARAALAETESKLAAPPDPGPEPGRPTPAGTPGRTFWFERFRWFVSSEGVIVIGGKDAPSNDLLVKRHLKEADRYVHADVHGAASVVVKHPPGGGEIGAETLREAGQWAVSFSKAWRAEHASADAFWVHPDQVSKSAGTGEFVARGAWVIHGTKEFLRDLPLELGLGPTLYEGEERWTVAPPSAVRARGELRFVLTPGDDRLRGEREVELARESGLSRSRLQSMLPAGGLTFRRA
jgi:predicted ribosome quality control (RQC) complex YloA/Tae2 family protein